MSESAPAGLIAELLQRHCREPTRHRAQLLREAPLPGNLDVVLRLALGLPVDVGGPAVREPDAAAQLERAAVSYIRHGFFRNGATHYEVLGLPPDATADCVRENFRLLMQLIHPDRQRAETIWPENYAARANRAYSILKVPDARAAYDRELAAARARDDAPRVAASPASGSGPRARFPAYRRRSMPTPVLPEWLTAGVGGFARNHPAEVTFAAIIAGSALIVSAMAWEGRDASLLRESRPPAATAVRAADVQPAPSVAPAAESPAHTADLSTIESVAKPPAAPLPATPVPVARSMATPASVPAPADPDAGAAKQSAGSAIAVAAMPTHVAPAALAPAAATARASDTDVSTDVAPVAAAVTLVAVLSAPPSGAAGPAVGGALSLPPATAEIEVLFAAFVESYERGRLDAMAALFADDAEMNVRRGRAAIRGDYDELFRQSSWRRMQLTRINWRRAGDRAYATGEIAVRIGWLDGREVQERLAVDFELVRQDGHAVIARLAQQPRN